MQCDRCRHDGTRGGVVLPQERACEFLEGHRSTVHLVLEKLCQQAAAQGNCPVFDEAVHPPDSYRAVDLPRSAWTKAPLPTPTLPPVTTESGDESQSPPRAARARQQTQPGAAARRTQSKDKP
jgi:hypothetical protein